MPITYDRKTFFDAVRDPVFDGRMTAEQVSGIANKQGTGILDCWEKRQPSGDTRFIAYMLATAAWETAHTMQPIEEIGKGRGHAYGAPAGPWHQVYDGKGLVQDTWYANYAKQDPILHQLGILKADESIVRTPDLVMRPDVASAVMFYGMIDGWFTGKKLSDYFSGTTTDWVSARRIINGTDRAGDIAAIAQAFYAALRAALVYRAAAPTTSVAPTPSPAAVPAPAAPQTAAPAPAKPTLLDRLSVFFGRH